MLKPWSIRVRRNLQNAMGLGKEVSDGQKRGIIACHKLGTTQKKIAELMGCSQASVSRVLAQKNTSFGKRTGRPRILTDRKTKRLTAALLKDKTSRRRNVKEVCQLFSEQNGGEKVSVRTMQRALKKEGIRSCIPRPKPLISAANRAKRLAFAQKYSHWTVYDWKRVVWSDESTFTQFQTSGWGRIWRTSDEEFHEDCIAATVKHSPSRMFWGCFSWASLGPIVPLSGSVTGSTHRETLEDYAIPTLKAYARQAKKKFVFQEDNAPVHTSKIAREFLKTQKVELLPWPAQSPDLNPIEELWSFVESGLRKRNPQPSNIHELETMIAEEWNAVSQKLYRKLIKSMPRRIEAVINANGGHITH
jgi:predicted transcriptional regulator